MAVAVLTLSQFRKLIGEQMLGELANAIMLVASSVMLAGPVAVKPVVAMLADPVAT